MPLWRGGRGTEKELEFPLRLGLHCKGKLGALVAPTTLLPETGFRVTEFLWLPA